MSLVMGISLPPPKSGPDGQHVTTLEILC